METRRENKSELMQEIAAKLRKSVGNRKFDIGLHWTYELNERFIRLRKESEQRFVGKRSGSFPARGWAYILKQLKIDDRMTPAQAKKKWEMYVSKYRDEKDPTRIGKPSDTPITWPLFPLMDWALADKHALQEKSKVYDYQITEQGEVILNTESNAASEILDEERAMLAENVSIVVIENTPVAEEEEVVGLELPEVTETVEERRPMPPVKRKPGVKRSAEVTPKKKGRRAASVVEAPSEEISVAVSSVLDTTPIQPAASITPAPPSPIPVVTQDSPPRTSVHQRVAAILDAEESLRASELREIRQQLTELTRLTRAQNETMRQQTEAAKQTAEALQLIAVNSERQALAMEKCVQLAEIKFGVKHTVEINFRDLESQ